MFYIKPAPGMIIVKADKEEKNKEGETSIPTRGTVIALGDPLRDSTIPCKEGDVVIFNRWQVIKIDLKDGEYLFGEYKHILGIEVVDVNENKNG